jgi:hypothetical protein
VLDTLCLFEACHCFALSWFSRLFYPFFARGARVRSEDFCERRLESWSRAEWMLLGEGLEVQGGSERSTETASRGGSEPPTYEPRGIW